MKLIIFYLLLLTPSAFYAQDVQKIYIDPSKAYGGNVSDYFASVEYIPLETTKESLFGDVQDLLITDNSFVIIDNDTRFVLFFSIDGTFVKKVKISPFASHSLFLRDNSVYITYFDNQTKTIGVDQYSSTGELLDKNNTSAKEFYTTIPLDNDYKIVVSNCRTMPSRAPKDSSINLVSIFKNNQLIKSFVPYNPLKDFGFCELSGRVDISRQQNKSDFYITTPFDHYVYKANKDTAIKSFQFVFPANRILNKEILFSRNKKLLDSLQYNLMRNTNIIHSVSNIIFNKDLLFFKINGVPTFARNISENLYQYNFIFNMVTQKLASFERMNSDTLSHYLPFIDIYSVVKGLDYYENAFYCPVSSLQMFTAKEATKSKNPQYPQVLQQYFKTQNRKSNPVIVKLKLK